MRGGMEGEREKGRDIKVKDGPSWLQEKQHKVKDACH